MSENNSPPTGFGVDNRSGILVPEKVAGPRNQDHAAIQGLTEDLKKKEEELAKARASTGPINDELKKSEAAKNFKDAGVKLPPNSILAPATKPPTFGDKVRKFGARATIALTIAGAVLMVKDLIQGHSTTQLQEKRNEFVNMYNKAGVAHGLAGKISPDDLTGCISEGTKEAFVQAKLEAYKLNGSMTADEFREKFSREARRTISDPSVPGSCAAQIKQAGAGADPDKVLAEAARDPKMAETLGRLQELKEDLKSNGLNMQPS